VTSFYGARFPGGETDAHLLILAKQRQETHPMPIKTLDISTWNTLKPLLEREKYIKIVVQNANPQDPTICGHRFTRAQDRHHLDRAAPPGARV
jgi:hypothetical protein